MSLDFAVLGLDGAPEKTVSLDVDLHHEFVTTAADYGLARFRDFADYYEDAEVSVDDLPSFGDQVRVLYAQTDSVVLRRFLDALMDLIDYAVAKGRSLHAIAD